jgi:hypothetical protein
MRQEHNTLYLTMDPHQTPSSYIQTQDLLCKPPYAKSTTMFRPCPTWISLPDREVYQILQTTHHIQRPKATIPWHVAELDVSDADETELETETETEYYYESASPSYSYAQNLAWSSPGRYTPDIRRGDSYIAENRLPVSVYARFGSRKVIQGDGNGRGDAGKTGWKGL